MVELTDYKGNKKEKSSGRKIKRTYGISDKILKDNSELVELLQILKDQRKKGIFYKATDVAQMVSETPWFMRHTEDWMKIQKDRASKDPALWDALMQEQAGNIKDKFLAAGADIDNPTALKYAEDITYGSGWNGDSFELFDEEGTGKITFTNLKRVAQELGEKLTDDELSEMIEEADRNKDGAIDSEEFYRVMKKRGDNPLDDLDPESDSD